MFKHALQFAPVSLCATGFLAVDLAASIGGELLKLRAERLAVGADTGIADAPDFGCYFGHIFRTP